MTPDEIKKKIADLTAERDMLVDNANRQIAFLNGKIETWAELLSEALEAFEVSNNGHVEEVEAMQ